MSLQSKLSENVDRESGKTLDRKSVMMRVVRSWRRQRLSKAMRCWYTNAIRAESWNMSAQLTELRIHFRKVEQVESKDVEVDTDAVEKEE